MLREIEDINKSNQNSEITLNKFGLHLLMNDPQLDNYAKLQIKTNLLYFNEINLKEIVLRNQFETLVNSENSLQVEIEIASLEKQIESDSKEILEIENCLKGSKILEKNDSELAKIKVVKEKFVKKTLEQEKKMTKTDFNLDELISKISQAELKLCADGDV